MLSTVNYRQVHVNSELPCLCVTSIDSLPCLFFLSAETRRIIGPRRCIDRFMGAGLTRNLHLVFSGYTILLFVFDEKE